MPDGMTAIPVELPGSDQGHALIAGFAEENQIWERFSVGDIRTAWTAYVNGMLHDLDSDFRRLFLMARIPGSGGISTGALIRRHWVEFFTAIGQKAKKTL